MIVLMPVRVIMAVIMTMLVVVIMRVLFEMLVMVLVGMIMPATTATAAARILLLRHMILRFQIKHFVVMLMGMIVAAPAAMIMMIVIVIVIMAMGVMIVMIMPVMVMAMATLIIGTTLGLERTLDRVHRATETTQHFNKHMIVFDIDRIRRDFGRRVTIADMPGGLHQAGGIFGADFDKLLRRGLHDDEATILQLQRVAIIQHDRLLKIEQEFGSGSALQRHAAAMAAFMIERDAVDHLVGFHGGLADGLGGTEHGETSLNSPFFRGLAGAMPACPRPASGAP